MRRKCLGIFVASIILVAMFLPCTECNVEAFSGIGNGIERSPYQIRNVAQLQEMEDDLSAYYVLHNDIDASATSGWGAGVGFDPVGTFTGSFDGEGYTISDLFINRPATSSIGLFSETDGAVIQNVILTNVNITGDWLIGGLIGYAVDTIISDCHVDGNIVGTDSIGVVGGLVGETDGTVVISGCGVRGTTNATAPGSSVGGIVGENRAILTIVDSYSTCSVAGDDYIGGIIGYSTAGTITITRCFSTGDITAVDWVGGIVGGSNDVGDSITDCYARGDITTGEKGAGGALGYYSGGEVSNSYSTGLVIGNFTIPAYGSSGGFHGYNGGTEEIGHCFWDKQTSNWTTSVTGTGKTTVQMKNQTTFTNWSFYSIWAIDTDGVVNDGYPYLAGTPPLLYGDDYVPSSLLAIPISSSEIALVWDMGVNTTETRIMGKAGGWPSTYNDPYATLVYEGNQTTVSHKGLDTGTTYYYRAWGKLGDGYSVDYAQDLATTLMGSEDNITVPMPPWWFQEPACTAYENIPVFGLIESTAASYDLPVNTACLLITIFLLLLASIIAFSITHNALTSGMVLAVAIVVASIAGLLPMWMLLVALLIVVGITFSWSRA